MTMLLWLSAALAAPPSSVEQVVWAAPFTLDAPHRYSHTSEPRDIASGWLLELAVDPTHMQPRQIGVPLLWVGDTLAVRTNWDHETGCAVVWVPDADPRTEPIFFHGTALPERIGATERAEARAHAASHRLDALPIEQRAEPIQAKRFIDLMRVAADRVEACSKADAARLNALRSR